MGGAPLAHVLQYLGDATQLGCGGGEGQAIEEAVHRWRVVFDGRSHGVAFAVSPASQDGELERQNLIEGQASAAPVGGSQIGRVVHVAESIGQPGQTGAPEHVIGQGFRDRSGGADDGLPGETAQVPSRHALGEAVDGG